MLLYLLKEIYWLNHLFTWGSFALYVVKIVELYVSTIGRQTSWHVCGLDLVVTRLNLKMQVHAQVRTWNLANKWNQEFRDDRDFDFFFLKSVPNDLPSLGNGQEKTIYVSFSARCNRPKTGLLNITEPAPVDGANEASISGDENNASSTNNASCASVRASNKILIYLFLAGCKQNSSAS